jgi:hypothetical protein
MLPVNFPQGVQLFHGLAEALAAGRAEQIEMIRSTFCSLTWRRKML